MPSESQLPIPSKPTARRFAARLAFFYGVLFGLSGTQLPFFPVWLRAIGQVDHYHRNAFGQFGVDPSTCVAPSRVSVKHENNSLESL